MKTHPFNIRISPDWRLYLARFREVARWRLLLCAAMAAAQAMAAWPVAFLLRRIFDHALPAADLHMLGLAVAGVFVATLAQAGITLATRSLALDVVKGVIAKLRGELAERLLTLPRAFHLRANRAALHATVVQDTERLDDMSIVLVTQFLPAAINVIGFVTILAWLRWPLCLALLAFWPVLFLASRGLRQRMRRSVRSFHEAFERYSQGILQLLHRLELTRTQSAETEELAAQQERITAMRAGGTGVAWQVTVHGTGHEILGTLAALVILLAGGIAVIHGTMTLGSLVSFFFVSRALNTAQNQLFQLVPKLIVGNDALHSLAPLLGDSHAHGDEHPFFTTPPYRGEKRPTHFHGEIEFRDVTFSYPAGAVRNPPQDPPAPLLRNISLKLVPGQITALIGENGAGKSTLLHLLLGFYRPTMGEVRADGQAFAALDLGWLRSRVGVVPQSPVFFHGTVRENLAYGCPQATDDRIRAALARAGADAFVEELPLQLETLIADDGARLSGGQRQRLALARALLRNPPLLVLDEPTTHLDPSAIDTLVETLSALEPRPAVLIVSHDQDVLIRCRVDRVFALRHGRLRPVPGTAESAALLPTLHSLSTQTTP